MNKQSFTPIHLGALYTYPVAINDAGAIADYFQRTNLIHQGFELVDLDVAEIFPPSSTATFVNGITAAGNLVGYADINSNYSNFGFRQGKSRTITIPEPTAPLLLGTNPAATALVGCYQAFSGIWLRFTGIEFSRRFHCRDRSPPLPQVSMRTATS